MKRSRIIADPILMLITIISIAAFQVYWLRQNYSREKRSLEIKTDAAFRQTVMQLQVAKLKLDGTYWNGKDSSKRKVKLYMNDGEDRVNIQVSPKNEIISTINILRDKLKDSLKKKPGMVISMNKTSVTTHNDSVNIIRIGDVERPPRGDHFFNMLYDVDSLQDSLRITEIDSAYRKVLQKEKLNVPFTIIKMDSTDETDERDFKQITVGFAHPVVYKLELGNTFPYLIRQIAQPIIFSILLLGITILSFVLLYKNLLRQRKLAEVKNEFISNITHELKTPIATVGVAIEALKNFNAIDDPQRTREYLDISQNELQRLGLLVDKVLKLSMFEKKEVELKYEMVDLKGVVDEVVSSLKLQLEKHRARVSVTKEGDTIILADRLHLLSVVFNLLDNAVKYSKEDPSIQVDLKERNGNVVMSVTDNGIGIAPEYKDKVFDKFFRIPHGDTHNAKGYGLGLSYVAQVIQKHNGTIAIESQPGIGTKFTITLPKSNT